MFRAENSIPRTCLSDFTLSGCLSLIFNLNPVAVGGVLSFDGANSHAQKISKGDGQSLLGFKAVNWTMSSPGPGEGDRHHLRSKECRYEINENGHGESACLVVSRDSCVLPELSPFLNNLSS